MADRIALVYRPEMPHQAKWCGAMWAGIAKADVEITTEPSPGDPVITWGWKQARPWRERGHAVLVMEFGNLGRRHDWCNLGWNGLAGRGVYPAAKDGGARWRRHFGDAMKPWRADGTYTLLIGQCRGDAATAGVDLLAWYAEAVTAATGEGRPVRFRPHPVEVGWGRAPEIDGAPTIEGSLAETLDQAALAVTWNSGAAVEAVLAGVPTIACDEGSPAWPVASHGLEAARIWPERETWAAAMAWRQWSLEEIASGEAWGYLRECRPC
ncbi:MAG TPA: hypothetical protein VMX97_17300 [Hyphomicrobiaceae bacterium]|nr:hypothetical protein [Hyphomicrobiaceae bacterium]